jgi:hypothetical protein
MLFKFLYKIKKEISFSFLISTFLINIFSYAKAENLIWQYDYKVLPLPGQLNDIPVANSNSPELVTTDGILLSTFPPKDKEYPDAHLDRAFNGKFEIFAHHVVYNRKDDFTDMYEGIILYNPLSKKVALNVFSSSSYTTTKSPFIKLLEYLPNNNGNIHAGPGDKVSQDILREKNLLKEKTIIIPSKSYYLLLNESIPISPKGKANARTSHFKLESDGELYFADLAMFREGEDKPNLKDWINILTKQDLSGKRDNIPTPLDDKKKDKFFYGRVSGVSKSSKWYSKITSDNNKYFEISKDSETIVYGINTLYNNTLSTKQVQSSEMEKRYYDTAYQSHGNYGLTYDIEIPIYNKSENPVSFSVSFDSPVRMPENTSSPISYMEKPPENIKFRGDIKVVYDSPLGDEITKYFHIVQRFGEQGKPLASILISPKEKKNIKITFVYPADCTPPHALTISY